MDLSDQNKPNPLMRLNAAGLFSSKKKVDLTYINPSATVKLISAESIEPEPIVWTLPDWLPQGAVSLLVGASSVGKSTLACSIAARVTQGESHPAWGDPRPSGWGNVMIVTKEDRYRNTIIPRLIAAGANMARIIFNTGVEFGNTNVPISWSNAEHLESLINQLNANGIALIVFDPIYQVVHGDSGKNSNARLAYENLSILAGNLNCAILGIAHTTKFPKGKTALSRIFGPGALSQVPRSIMIASEINEPLPDKETHILVLAKSFGKSVNHGLTYSLENFVLPNTDDTIVEAPKLIWHMPRQGTPFQNLEWAEQNKQTKPDVPDHSKSTTIKIDKREIAKLFLKETLAHGPVSVPDIHNLAYKKNISKATLGRANLDLRIISELKPGTGPQRPHIWSLPQDE
jgi:putative DNA primase/helicase